MADSRKRRQPLGSMPTARQQQRKRPRCPEKMTIVKAAVAIAILLSVVATTAVVIQGSAPKNRQRIHEPRRLVWEEHRVDLARRCMFRRMYRMEEQTFNKLAELLRPILSHNDYYASECCTVRIEDWWVGVWMSGREQRLHYCCTAVWCPWLPVDSSPIAVCLLLLVMADRRKRTFRWDLRLQIANSKTHEKNARKSARPERLHYCCTAVWCPWLPLFHRLPLSAYCCHTTASSMTSSSRLSSLLGELGGDVMYPASRALFVVGVIGFRREPPACEEEVPEPAPCEGRTPVWRVPAVAGAVGAAPGEEITPLGRVPVAASAVGASCGR